MKQFLLSAMLLSGLGIGESQAKFTNLYWSNPAVETSTSGQANNAASKDNSDESQALLPEEIIDINANSSGSNGIVSWGSGHTHRSIPPSYYILERSFDGRQFSAIQTVAIRSSGDYTITDAGVWNSAPARVWYRLQMVDNNGNTTYSSVVELVGGPATN